jgi:putative oxidoreductase
MSYHHEIAVETFTRVLLGILFFAQGFDKVFNIGVKEVIHTFEYPMRLKHLPRSPLVIAAYYTSYAELIGGALLIIGFMKYYALYLLGIDMLIVCIAFSSLDPMWDMKFVFPRAVLLITLFLIPAEWGVIAIDHCWSIIRYVNQLIS